MVPADKADTHAQVCIKDLRYPAENEVVTGQQNCQVENRGPDVNEEEQEKSETIKRIVEPGALDTENW